MVCESSERVTHLKELVLFIDFFVCHINVAVFFTGKEKHKCGQYLFSLHYYVPSLYLAKHVSTIIDSMQDSLATGANSATSQSFRHVYLIYPDHLKEVENYSGLRFDKLLRLAGAAFDSRLC